MATYIVLIRGINVGGKNKVSMASLKKYLEELDYASVTTIGASGNIILESGKSAKAIQSQVEKLLLEKFKLDDELIKVLVLSRKQYEAVISSKPKGFGDHPDKYYSDAIFLMGITAAKSMPIFDPREGVDQIWQGKGVIYSQRLGSQRTKSRLSKIVASPAYKSMTIRSWSTTTKLLALLEKKE